MEVFVYVIASSEEGPVKIGFSKDVSKRLRQLQTGHAEKLHVFHKRALDKKHALIVEKAVHDTLKHSRRQGEWFALDVENAILEVDFAVITFASEVCD